MGREEASRGVARDFWGGWHVRVHVPTHELREGGRRPAWTAQTEPDTVGRRFPLIVFGRFPEKQAAAGPQLLPLLTEPFVAAAELALTDGDKVTSAADFQKHIGPMQSAVIASDGVEGAYDTWSHGTSLSVLWTTIDGDPHSPAPLLALKSIHEAVAPFSHQENASTPLGLRFPLGGGGAGVASFGSMSCVASPTGARRRRPASGHSTIVRPVS